MAAIHVPTTRNLVDEITGAKHVSIKAPGSLPAKRRTRRSASLHPWRATVPRGRKQGCAILWRAMLCHGRFSFRCDGTQIQRPATCTRGSASLQKMGSGSRAQFVALRAWPGSGSKRKWVKGTESGSGSAAGAPRRKSSSRSCRDKMKARAMFSTSLTKLSGFRHF